MIIAHVNVIDALTPHYRQVVGTLDSTRPRIARLGKTAEVIFKKHFDELSRRSTKRGFSKRNFWTQIKRSTALTSVVKREATVSVSDPRLNAEISGNEAAVAY